MIYLICSVVLFWNWNFSISQQTRECYALRCLYLWQGNGLNFYFILSLYFYNNEPGKLWRKLYCIEFFCRHVVSKSQTGVKYIVTGKNESCQVNHPFWISRLLIWGTTWPRRHKIRSCFQLTQFYFFLYIFFFYNKALVQ